MAMRCPACPGDLIPVETQDHYGTGLEIDTCVECQGFWLDPGETKRMGHRAAVTLEGGTDLSEISTQQRTEPRLCPRCGVELREVSGGQLPEGLHVDICAQCKGRWFDRGELLVVKSALEAERRRRVEAGKDQLRKERRDRNVWRGPEPEPSFWQRTHRGAFSVDLRRLLDSDVL